MHLFRPIQRRRKINSEKMRVKMFLLISLWNPLWKLIISFILQKIKSQFLLSNETYFYENNSGGKWITDSQNLSKCKLLLKKLWIARTLRKPLRLFYLLFQLVLLSEKLLCLFFQVLKKTKQTKVSQKRTLKGISNKCISEKMLS